MRPGSCSDPGLDPIPGGPQVWVRHLPLGGSQADLPGCTEAGVFDSSWTHLNCLS